MPAMTREESSLFLIIVNGKIREESCLDQIIENGTINASYNTKKL